MDYSDHVVAKAGGGDWSMFAFEGGAALVDGVAVLDGVNDALTANLALDYAGKSVWAVVKITGTDNAQDTALQVNSSTTNSVGIAAQTIGQFRAQLRTPGTAAGYGAALVNPVNVAEAGTNILGRWALIGLMFDGGKAYVINGADGIGVTACPAVINMLRLVFGRNAKGAGFTKMDVAELVVLDTCDVAVVDACLQDLGLRHILPVPVLTPLKGTMIAITGDSNGVGVKASAIPKRWHYIAAQALLADATCYAWADSQLSPFGMTPGVDDPKIAATFARVFTPATLAGKSIAINLAGANDWWENVPLGVFGDTAENTIYGALHAGVHGGVGGAGFLANAAPTAIVWICTTVNPHTEALNDLGLRVTDYDAVIRDFIARTNHPRVRLLDIRQLGLVLPDHFNPDGFHTNDAGNALIGAMALATVAAEFGIFR